MMAKEDYKKEKCALSSSASPNPINKKPNSDYFVDPNGLHFDTKSNQFPFKSFNKQFIRSCGPSPDHVITLPPMKRADCEDAPPPENFAARPDTLPSFDDPPQYTIITILTTPYC
ncbi:hypothetical protein DSO57_1010907 [Entomophthora muscae]|uniref:Uncharacterized protein n=1 Tax=Entomophthora muscae TaxID=34485 RepID=A0ACC2U4Y7_9FUNG|nr:hypothetical protein DSO57_1010907 [Entomophthora muscae]